MVLEAGKKCLCIPDGRGGYTAYEISAPAVGEKCILLPDGKGGYIAVGTGVPSVGDKVPVVPDGKGGYLTWKPVAGYLRERVAIVFYSLDFWYGVIERQYEVGGSYTYFLQRRSIDDMHLIYEMEWSDIPIGTGARYSADSTYLFAIYYTTDLIYVRRWNAESLEYIDQRSFSRVGTPTTITASSDYIIFRRDFNSPYFRIYNQSDLSFVKQCEYGKHYGAMYIGGDNVAVYFKIAPAYDSKVYKYNMSTCGYIGEIITLSFSVIYTDEPYISLKDGGDAIIVTDDVYLYTSNIHCYKYESGSLAWEETFDLNTLNPV